MIQSYFDYCNIIWLNPNSAQINKLQILQNRALRLIMNVDSIHNRRDFYETLNIDCLSVKIKKKSFTAYIQNDKSYCPRIYLL